MNAPFKPSQWSFYEPPKLYGSSAKVVLNQNNMSFNPDDILVLRVSVGEKKGTASLEGRVVGWKVTVVSVQRLSEGDPRKTQEEIEEERQEDMIDMCDPEIVEDANLRRMYEEQAAREISNLKNNNNTTFIAGLENFGKNYRYVSPPFISRISPL